MSKVLYECDGRIARITLNRPDVLNAIDDDVPQELAAAVERADRDPHVHVIVLAGAGRAFCAGYDLTYYAEATGSNSVTQEMPWDPMKDYAFMMRNTELFMSLFRSKRPVIAKVHGFAVAGGSDIALCSDIIVMAENARIGYMPVRVWGCPTTAMWLYRLGPEKAKRMLFTGDKIDGREAASLGLVLKAVSADKLDDEVEALAHRIAGVPQNQLMMQKLMINQALYNMGLQSTQMIATVFDGITRHSSLVATAAALPVLALPAAAAAAAEPDPIFAAIEQHRLAYRACNDLPGDIPDDLGEHLSECVVRIAITKPTTLAGIVAVLRFPRRRGESDGWSGRRTGVAGLPRSIDCPTTRAPCAIAV